MSIDAFQAITPYQIDYAITQLITSTATATYYDVNESTMKMAVRGNPVYYQWGIKQSTTPTASGAAATQMDWAPQDSSQRLAKPEKCTGIWILQDGGAATVFITPGHGI